MQHMLRARMSRADQGLAVAGADARPAGPPKAEAGGLRRPAAPRAAPRLFQIWLDSAAQRDDCNVGNLCR